MKSKRTLFILLGVIAVGIVAAVIGILLIPKTPVIPETPATDFEYYVGEDFVRINDYLGDDEIVKIPSVIEDRSVTRIGSAFMSKDIKAVYIPDSVTAIEDDAFWGCSNLTDVEFGDGITLIRYQAFYKCSALKKVILPKNLESIDTYAFSECTSLEEVFIPKTVTDWGMSCFMGATALTSITFEEGLSEIGGYATFMGATALESVTIPASVKEIGDIAFAGCDSLKSVTFLGDAPTVSADVFGPPNKDLIIYYNANTAGWDNTPLADWYTLVAS